ncbi:alpha/beta fold hydrolase [Vagococcus intermedius]|uniref:Alpha/beta hydrolase n=1 Tax=Vagococcus intermedius TaxID=2991418 RepID=A0AAF0I5Y0_9ENTE|nr:alpha/beta fold hydrolase [Vagococcus intermedius]WEG73243.1 alpha/beta hydrolase [Vagococcus intermedius]WEG75328.1 alpha/beta hydrolase [Vagococcus intermedius]
MEENKWLKRLLAAGGLGVTGYCLGRYVRFKRERAERLLDETQLPKGVTPTLFLHGTYGTKYSLGRMIKRFEKAGYAERSLEIIVERNHHLVIQGNIEKLQTVERPLVHIIFKEMQPSEWQQGEWLHQIMLLLKQKLIIDDVYFVGHSMGGVAALRYLVDYGYDPKLPQITKLVTLGSPFNGEEVSNDSMTELDLSEKGPQERNATYRYLEAAQERLPKTLSFLNIYGDLGNGSRSDGTVPVDSVKAISYLLEPVIESYHEVAIYGWQGQHMLLHENSDVDDVMAEFLWPDANKE